jgi:hypothetical protein
MYHTKTEIHVVKIKPKYSCFPQSLDQIITEMQTSIVLHTYNQNQKLTKLHL